MSGATTNPEKMLMMENENIENGSNVVYSDQFWLGVICGWILIILLCFICCLIYMLAVWILRKAPSKKTDDSQGYEWSIFRAYICCMIIALLDKILVRLID